MKKICPLCDTENEEEAGFCRECGESLAEMETEEETQSSTKNKISQGKFLERRTDYRVGRKKHSRHLETKTKNVFFLLIMLLALLVVVYLNDPSIERPKQNNAVLALSSEDILITAEEGNFITQCYTTNNGNMAWVGSVRMVVQDMNGDLLYSGADVSWPEMKIDPGERDYLVARIPMNASILSAPEGILVIVWNWGRQEVSKRIEIR